MLKKIISGKIETDDDGTKLVSRKEQSKINNYICHTKYTNAIRVLESNVIAPDNNNILNAMQVLYLNDF